jgi:RNA polymerase sigma-70 factor (ECF subfamily)
MHNMTREHLRTKKRAVSRESPITDSQLAGLGAASESGTPSQALMNEELGVRLAVALQSLPDDQREAIRERYFEGSSLEDIARTMKRTKPAIAGLLKRGLDALRKEFE